jgi:hypothetical protein
LFGFIMSRPLARRLKALTPQPTPGARAISRLRPSTGQRRDRLSQPAPAPYGRASARAAAIPAGAGHPGGA